MDQDRINERAYALWEQAGKPEGAHEEHRHQVSREIEAEDGQSASDQTKAAEVTTGTRDKSVKSNWRGRNTTSRRPRTMAAV